MSATSTDVFLACHMAVRLSLQSAGKSVLNRRGRSHRAHYQSVPLDDLYLVLDPPATAAELDRWDQSFTSWWGLPSALHDEQIPHIDLIMQACHEYVRKLMMSQAKHDPDALRAWLREVDNVAAAAH